MCQTIAADEAAHYHFYLEVGRIILYYSPAEGVEAIEDVLREFAMPAQLIIPNWPEIQDAILRTSVYGPRIFFHDVLQVALGQLSAENRKLIRDGIRRMRTVPDEDGHMRDTIAAEILDVPHLMTDVRQAFARIHEHEAATGLDIVNPTVLEPGPLNAMVARDPIHSPAEAPVIVA
jgi:acyl-[acyl-carrier-protein] desaturase